MKQYKWQLILRCVIPAAPQRLKPFWLGAFTCALVACGPTEQNAATPAIPPHLLATALQDIRVLQIPEQDCAEVLRNNLAQHGFHLSDGRQAGAILHLQLSQLRPLRESLPLIKTLGSQAKYRADLIGHEQTPLLSLYGQEGSLSFTELCDDISDEIADKLTTHLSSEK